MCSSIRNDECCSRIRTSGLNGSGGRSSDWGGKSSRDGVDGGGWVCVVKLLIFDLVLRVLGRW